MLTLITQNEEVSLKLMSKEDAANVILDKIFCFKREGSVTRLPGSGQIKIPARSSAPYCIPEEGTITRRKK